MMSLLLVFISLVLILSVSCSDVILQPVSGKIGDDVVLFFAQGASIPPSSYIPLLSLLQSKISYPLWIGIPQCLDDSCAVPNTLSDGMKRVEATMISQGMNVNISKRFYAGHSLGGAVLPDYIISEKVNSTTGIILLGAFLTRKFKTGVTSEGTPQVVFPVPSLTIGGELDGLCRITRIVEALHTQVSMASSPSVAMGYMPVTIIESMNHMQFASGVPPSFVANNDLQSEISESEAHQLVVQDMSLFMSSLVSPSSISSSSISERVEESVTFAKPIVDGFKMEGYFQFLPPCLCETPDEYGGLEYGTCLSTPACQGGSPWTSQFSQAIIGAIDGLTIKNTDSIHFLEEEHPSCHLAHIHGSATRTNTNNGNPGDGDTAPLCDQTEGCVLTITTVTEPSYDNSGEVDVWREHFSLDNFDTGFLPISAKELKTKLKSRQAILEAAGIKNVNFTISDVPVADGGTSNRCGDINQKSIEWALMTIPKKTADRYKQVGQQIIIGQDEGTCKAGPCFIWNPIKYLKNDDANTMTVESVWFGSENHNNYPCGEDKKLPCDAGFHYCKILSPARAIEWMYVDGLKNKYSTKNLIIG